MIKGGLYMWYKAESSELPSTIDDTSSRVYVYVRKNINVEQRTDESGEIITVYVYDESNPLHAFRLHHYAEDKVAG
jgi:hypothetical protein